MRKTNRDQWSDGLRRETSEPKYRIITLINTAPIRIREDQWPEIARGDANGGASGDTDGAVVIRVRRHQDGRVIVYGVCKPYRAGVLLSAVNSDVAAAINKVAAQLVVRVRDRGMHPHIRDAGGRVHCAVTGSGWP